MAARRPTTRMAATSQAMASTRARAGTSCLQPWLTSPLTTTWAATIRGA
ncbi:hypothetical protein HaLaN_26462, partial [Haematococcus lacustris]